MLSKGEFFAGAGAALSLPACTPAHMHVSLRSQDCHGLQCHWFEAKVISNLKVASMPAHINYLLHFFHFRFGQLTFLKHNP